MLLEAIYHRPKSNYAYAYDQETMHVRVRTSKGDMQSVELHYFDKYDMPGTQAYVSMRKIASDTLFDYYQAEVKPPYRRFAYAFYFTDTSGNAIWMNEKGFLAQKPEIPTGLYEFPFLNPIDILTPPEWVKDAIFYQIFPERFANGDPANDPKNVEPWGGKPHYDNFFGGDLQGVIDHLDHLTDLGVNAIYFTPLFEATTNHKYDTIDYLKVDQHFGDNALLKKLVALCHARGIKVMLDAVFNHAGYYFPPFQDVVKNQENSKYVDWFHIREFPIQIEPRPNYDTFAFTHMMPKFNTENPEVKEYLLQVARYWIEEVGIDGWRLDVANEVDHAFWRDFRRVVKQANPEAYILGEIWHNSMAWLQGDQFDAVMNYPVTNTTLDFFCKAEINNEQFQSGIQTIYIEYPLQTNEVAFNLLDSHDTPRLLTICKEDTRRMKLAAAFQLTYLGTPCIYYGDEFGMTGEHDPDCRKTMVWDEEQQNKDLFTFYQTMIALRKKHAALRQGEFSFLELKQHDGKQIAYLRKANGESFLMLMNAAEEMVEIKLKQEVEGHWHYIYGTQGTTALKQTLKLEPLSFLLFRKEG